MHHFGGWAVLGEGSCLFSTCKNPASVKVTQRNLSSNTRANIISIIILLIIINFLIFFICINYKMVWERVYYYYYMFKEVHSWTRGRSRNRNKIKIRKMGETLEQYIDVTLFKGPIIYYKKEELIKKQMKRINK